MANANRPLSPHLQVYRPQITSVLSILHRGTGIVLSIALIGLVVWLAAAASGPAAFEQTQAIYGSLLGKLVILGATFSFFYHLCNGIRHIAWDIGLGFELPQVYASGWAVVIAAVALTALAWIVALMSFGGAA